MSVSEMDTASKKIKGLAFIKEFIKTQSSETSLDVMANNLIKHVNNNLRYNSVNINPWIQNESYWDEDDYSLNTKGAYELLTIEKRETAKSLFSEWVSQGVQKMMENECSGTNALMQELTGITNIQNGSHQSIYLKNLIGNLVGVSNGVNFDRHTGVLYDELLIKNRDEVLAIFFKHMTPEVMITSIIRDSIDMPKETKEALKLYLSDHFFDNQGDLNKSGALELLRTLQYLS